MTGRHEEHGSLTPFQFTSVIAGTIIGVAALILPRLMTEAAGHGALPLAMAVGSLVSLVTVYCWVKVGASFPGLTVTEYAEHLIGRAPAFVLHLVALAFITVFSALVAREFGEVVITAILTQTPLEVTTITMLALATIFIRYDLQVIARTFELLFPLIVFPGVFVALLSLRNARTIHLLPIWEGDWEAFGFAVMLAAATLQGTVIMPLFIPSVNIPRQTMRAGLWAVGISGIVHVLIVTAALAVFNVNEMERLLWPTLELMRTTVVPGNVLERIEAIFLAVWVAAVFTTIAGTFYAAIIIIQKLFKLQDHKTAIPLVAPWLYVIAMQPDNILSLYAFLRIWVPLGLNITVIAPLVLYIAAKIRGLKEQPS